MLVAVRAAVAVAARLAEVEWREEVEVEADDDMLLGF